MHKDVAVSSPNRIAQVGQMAAVIGCNNSSEPALVVTSPQRFVSGASQVSIASSVQSSDPSTATLVVDGYVVDYSGLLSTSQVINIRAGDFVLVQGKLY